MHFLKYILIGLMVCFLSIGLAKDMVADSEQFYVTQGVFTDLGITIEACNMEDDVVNFICGIYSKDAQSFQAEINGHIIQNLPGLTPTSDWFNSADTIVRSFQSSQGQYLFAYNNDGFVVVAFTPN